MSLPLEGIKIIDLTQVQAPRARSEIATMSKNGVEKLTIVKSTRCTHSSAVGLKMQEIVTPDERS